MGLQQTNSLNDRFNVEELKVGSRVWWGSKDNVVVGKIVSIDDTVHMERLGRGLEYRPYQLCLVVAPGVPEEVWPAAGAYMGTHELAYHYGLQYVHHRAHMVRGEWASCIKSDLAFRSHLDAVVGFAKAYMHHSGEGITVKDMAGHQVQFIEVPVLPADEFGDGDDE